MEEILNADLFCLYKKTYPNADYSQIWEAYESVAELWRKTGIFISERCGYEYPKKTEQDMTEFIHCLKKHKLTDIYDEKYTDRKGKQS